MAKDPHSPMIHFKIFNHRNLFINHAFSGNARVAEGAQRLNNTACGRRHELWKMTSCSIRPPPSHLQHIATPPRNHAVIIFKSLSSSLRKSLCACNVCVWIRAQALLLRVFIQPKPCLGSPWALPWLSLGPWPGPSLTSGRAFG